MKFMRNKTTYSGFSETRLQNRNLQNKLSMLSMKKMKVILQTVC